MDTLAFLFLDEPALLLLVIPPLLLSLTLHEFAHARVALAFGDPTALRAGRVTLNPLKHLDPMGTILLFIVGFGWAKPVPVNPYLLRPPRIGDIMVSIAGPLTNLALAIIAACMLKIFIAVMVASGSEIEPGNINGMIFVALKFTMMINVCLCTFNLIPLYPLDGHHILREILPSHAKEGFMRWQLHYGRFIMLALWAGPPLLSRFTGKADFPDPFGWLLGQVFGLSMHLFNLV
jgi:Zn-dependent protease